MIEKLRELVLAGDKEAEKQVQDLEATRRAGDLTRALKFERDLLVLARDKFELISPLEFVDLERLQADRNRCAHPSLSSDEQAYMPSAELARLHIHSAVIHFLQHPPVQGKYALDRLLKEVESDYFPTTPKDALVFFASGPLRRPRESLVRNLTTVIAKSLLKDKPEWKRRMRLAAALQAIQQLHPEHYARSFGEKLTSMFRAVEDSELRSAVEILEDVPDTWQYLDADVRQRLQNYVLALPGEDFNETEFLLQYSPLQLQARQRVWRATKIELRDYIFFDMPSEIADRYVEIYLDSGSFDDANEWAKQIVLHAGEFNAAHVRKILINAARNTQVRGSFQLGPLIGALRSREKLPKEEFERLLGENDLGEYSSASR